jgi:GTP-binding protein HflX
VIGVASRADEIGAGRVPELLVLNKADLAPEAARSLLAAHEGSVAVSALTGEGIEVFLRTLGDRVRSLTAVVELAIPFDRGDVLAAVHREGEVLSTSHTESATVVRARLSQASAGRLGEFVTGGGGGTT